MWRPPISAPEESEDETQMKVESRQVGALWVHIYETRAELGAAAAADTAARLRGIIEKNGAANVIFAAAPSQNELLAGLLEADVEWTRVRAFHMDEYIGIDADEPAGFGNFLDRAIFTKLPVMERHSLRCETGDAREKCDAYAALLKKYPPDIVLLGIGENGHLAFNDPAEADFNDPLMIKIVDLDEVCRRQQVNDGCFARIEDVPRQAITMTMSCLMKVPEAVCAVPGARKADAVYGTLLGPVSTRCPASILRQHGNAALYLDVDSASRVL